MSSLQPTRPLLLITGSSGLIGQRLTRLFSSEFEVVGLDLEPAESSAPGVHWTRCDLTEEESVRGALRQIRDQFGSRLASVIHLAAYYDFSGEPSPLYRTLTVEGTRRLLQALQDFEVEQFVFSSTLLVMQSADDDEPVNEASPVDAEWDYPQSKLAAEQVIREERGEIPAVILRIAGVYDEECHSLPIAQQIRRIYEKQMESYFFPGDKTHGQAFVHLDDLSDCFVRTVERRAELSDYVVLLIGEEDVMSYEQLQDRLGELIHGKEWPTFRIPKVMAKAGAWAKNKLADEDEAQFIKPWMIDLADQNYPVSIERARKLLGWSPRHTLRETLPEMTARLTRQPRHWYEVNGLPYPEDRDR